MGLWGCWDVERMREKDEIKINQTKKFINFFASTTFYCKSFYLYIFYSFFRNNIFFVEDLLLMNENLESIS